jgi:hypothetical protein
MNRNNIIFLILVIISQVFQKKKWLDLSLYFENIMIKKEKGLILLNSYFIMLNVCWRHAIIFKNRRKDSCILIVKMQNKRIGV